MHLKLQFCFLLWIPILFAGFSGCTTKLQWDPALSVDKKQHSRGFHSEFRLFTAVSEEKVTDSFSVDTISPKSHTPEVQYAPEHSGKISSTSNEEVKPEAERLANNISGNRQSKHKQKSGQKTHNQLHRVTYDRKENSRSKSSPVNIKYSTHGFIEGHSSASQLILLVPGFVWALLSIFFLALLIYFYWYSITHRDE